MTAPQTPDLKTIKGRQQKAWSSGDYGKVGVTLSMMAELLAEAADLTPGQSVLDVASGNGNASLAAARRFCEVSAIDYVPMLLEEGRKRAEAEGLSVHFREGDAENLPFGDASFDAVLSTLGVMFAPDQEKAAGELLRVVRPGGTIGMANWVPDGYVGDLFRTIGRHVPPPAGLKPPFRWGTEEGLDELLGEGIGSLQTRRRTFIWRFPSARHHVDFMRGYYGPLNKAFGALDEAGQNALEGDLISLAVGGQARPRLDHLHRQLHRGPRRRHPRRRRVRHRLHRDRGWWPTGARMHAQQGNKIVGNYIGTDKTGTADLGNGDDGVNISAAPNNTVGDTTVGARNVISRNEHGVVIYGAGATGNRVMQNVISRNDETGVAVSDDGAKGNRILSNSVFANGLLGIDLGADGPTANDPGDTDTGPNNLQNKPVLRQEGRHRHYHGQGHPELRPGQDLQRPVLLQPRGRGGGQEPPRLQVGYGRRNGQRLVRLLDD